ncbi:hypothetical protein JCM31598_42920 [Desulfonatronum parangueonense]
MADKYPVKAESLYSHIYSGHLRAEKDQLVNDLAENHDSEGQLYVIGDCHLVSDSKFETDVIRFGTGQLLTDLLSFTNLAETKRKIIFVGDPFQMARGKLEETALCTERIKALVEVEVARIDIDRLLPETADDPFIKNCVELAGVMRRGIFNRLELSLDESSCVEMPRDPGQRGEVVRRLISELPLDSKFIAFSHSEVNRLNEWIRKHVFSRQGSLTTGDLIHVHNGFYATSKDDFSQKIFIPNDSFAEVVSVETVAPIVQSLRGRKDSVVVPLLRVEARVDGRSDVVEFLSLKNYLYSEKPEIDGESLLALRVFAETRYRQMHVKESVSNGDKQIDLENKNEEITKIPHNQRAKFMSNDPFLNAARMRFGYALTLHRAQGRKFDTVIASLNTGQGQTNDAYFRWLYTLITIPLRTLYLSNVPSITPLSKASWDASRARLDSVRPTNLIPFDPSKGLFGTEELKFPIEKVELRALYFFIDKAIKKVASQVDSIEHHNYQELYRIRGPKGQLCRLRLFFNKRFHVTRIETVDSIPTEFATEVIEKLTDGHRFENDLQYELYAILHKRFESCGISIKSIDHAAYQEVYYIKTASGDVKLQVHYDGDGFFTRLLPVAYTNIAAVDVVRNSLGF